MEKIKKWRRFALALLSLFFVAIFSFALVQIIPARAEETSVTIHADANGSVKYAVTDSAQAPTDEQYTQTIDANGSSEATIPQGQYLHLKATTTDAESYIFQYWTTDSAGNNAISMRAEDTFTYEECQGKITNVYAKFVKQLASDLREKARLKVSYDDTLGSVYFFFGKADVTEDELRNHGLLIPANIPTDIPWNLSNDSIAQNSKNQNQNSIALAALPNLQGANGMSVRFGEWSCAYKFDESSDVEFYEAQKLPSYLYGAVLTTDHETGAPMGGKEKDVGEIWRSSFWNYSSNSNRENLRITSEQLIENSSKSYWLYYKIDDTKNFGPELYVDPQSLHAEFQKDAPVPTMHITPTVNGEQQGTIDSTDRETTVSIQYSESNSLKVLLDAFPEIETKEQHYTIFVEGARDLSTGKRTTKPITGEWIGDQFGFNVPDLTVNSDIIITPDYGTGYFTEPITIHVNLTATEDPQVALNTILAADSGAITVENDETNAWYFDPQFNGSESNAFISGISYSNILYQPNSQNFSSICFNITGSGVLRFEFYLDGYGWLDSQGRIGSAALLSVAAKPLSNDPTLLAAAESHANATGILEHNSCTPVGMKMTSEVPDTQVTVTPSMDKDGWCTVTVQISGSENEAVMYCLTHFVQEDKFNFDDNAVEQFQSLTVMAVRNVAFYQGACDVDWGIYRNEGNEKNDYGTVTAKINGVAETENSKQNVQPGTQIEFSVSDLNSNTFYGWSDGENLLSTDETFTYTVHGAAGQTTAMHIYAVIEEKDGYAFRNGGKFYKDNELQTALAGASKILQIYVLKSVSVEGEFTIPMNVDFIVPYNADGEYFGCAPTAEADKTNSAQFSWHNSSFEKPFIEFTFSGTMNVAGTFRIGAMMNYPTQGMQGHTSGAYSKFINNGKVIVNGGGLMDIYGLVTGTGSFEVQANGNLAEPFLILDYAGGTNTFGLYSDKQTPFNRYAMVNVQCEGGITVDYQGQLIGHASLYAMSSFFFAEAPVISYNLGESDKGAAARGLITLTSGGKAVIKYTEENKLSNDGNCTSWIGKTELTLSGGATANHMSLDVGIKISTEDVQAFAIPYNFDIKLENGTFAINGNFKLMPGASLTVGKGATLDLNADFYVYDGFKQSDMSGKLYPSSDDLKEAGYTPNANFIVNGTFNINAGATFMGVVQTNYDAGKPAKIVVAAGVKSLGGEVTDGALTGYDCNVVKFTSSARVWDAAHGVIGTLEKGNTYHAATSATWELPSMTLKYAANLAEGEAASDDLPAGGDSRPGHIWKEFSTPSVSGMVGSWKVEHTSHSFDFNELTEADKNFAGAKFKEIKHLCGELGCDEGVVILNMEGFEAEKFAATYRGKEFTVEEIAKIFRSYFLNEDLLKYFTVTVTNNGGSIANYAESGYTVTVALTRGYFVGGEGGEASRTFTFTVEQLNITENEDVKVEFVVDINDIVYTGKEQTPNVQSVTVNGLSVTHDDYVWKDNKNAGTAHLKIIGNGNFTGTFDYTFEIKKAPLTLTANSAEGDYGTEHNNLGYTLEGAVEGEEAKLKALVTCSTTAEQWSDVRSNYTTSAAFGEDAEGLLKNYDIKPFVNGVYTVKQKDITGVATMSAASVTYNGKEQKAELQIAFEGYIDHFADDEDYTVTYAKGAETTPKNAGTYTVTLTGTGNYTGKITCSYEIKKAAVTVTVKPQTYTYNRAAQSYNDKQAEAWTATDLQNGESESVLEVTIAGSGTNAGTYPVECNYKQDGNYTVTFEGKETALVIEKAEITEIEVTSGALTYNGNDQTDDLRFTVKAGDSLTLNAGEYTVEYSGEKYTNQGIKNAGTYTVTVKAKSDNFKDGTAAVTATFEIAKAKVTVKANDQTTPQNEQVTKEFTYIVSDGTFFNDDEAEIKLHFQYKTEAVSDAVKDFDIVIDWAEGYTCDNYEVTFENGTYHIIDAIFKNVTVEGDGQITYDGQSHTLTVEVNNETLAGKTTITITQDGAEFGGATNAGTYSLRVEITADGYQTKYSSNFTLTITKRAVTVTFDGQSMVYGETPKSGMGLTYTMSEGVVLEKDQETVKGAISPTTTATNTSVVNGSYKITAEKPELQNYDVTIVDGAYTITPASLTVTIEESGHEYGAAVGALDVTLQGVKNGEEESIKAAIKLTTKAEQWSDKGNYAITAEYEAKTGVLANYDVNVTNNNAEIYEVTVKDITDVATMSASDKTYSGKAQEAELTIVFENYLTHFIKGTDYTVSYKKGESAVTPLNADTYTVTVTGKGNYAGTIECAFVIGKATIDAVVVEDAYTYTGEVQRPVLKVTAKGGDNAVLTLSEGEYEAAYTKGGETAAVKDAGRYMVTITSKSGNYQTAGAVSTTFEIAKAKITVKADDVKTVYGEATYGSAGKPFPFTVKEDTPLLGGDQKDVLHVDLYVGATVNEAKTYTITGTGSADNYDVTVEDGTYTVEQRKVTITIKDQEKVYDGTVPTVADSEWTAPENAIVAGDNLFVKLTVQDAAADVLMKDGKVIGYVITGEATNSNYDVEFVNGTYTVKPRAVTVEIYNQSATYDYALAGKNGYTFNAAAWAVEAESLAPGEEKTVLGVTLQKPEMSDAGEYAITGSAANANYAVTFTGKYAGAGESAGKAGVYTVMKKDVSLEALFVLLINGESDGTEGASTFYAKYAGDPLTLTGGATVNGEAAPLNVTIDPEIIEEIGNYPVTLTIVDKNYCGSTEFTVIVADKDGYTENLLSTLDALEQLVTGLDIDHLTTADYATLVEIYKALQGLSEEEQEVGAAELAAYQAYVDAWEELADIDDVIETAEEIADAPIAGLFEAVATLTALAGLAYIAMKGGLL